MSAGPADVPLTLEALRERAASGERFRYLYFWGHRPRADGRASAACFSQWYDAPFVIDGRRYATAEHWMMAEKARLFGDDSALARVFEKDDPGAAKAAGRSVSNFDEAIWLQHRFGIVVRGNRAKFDQHPALRNFLLGTGIQVLVEASPVDAVWGIGLAGDDPRAQDAASWLGLNLLGFALMAVRAGVTAVD